MNDKLPQPPRLATWFLHLFLKNELRSEVTADLLEQYDEKLAGTSRFRANVNYWYQVVHYFRPFSIKAFRAPTTQSAMMYKSYTKTSLRGMMKNKLHTFINITGLSVGMAVAMIIGLWLWDELSFDKQFSRYDRIGQIKQTLINNGELQMWSNLPWPLTGEIRSNYSSDFEEIAMTTNYNVWLVAMGENKLYENGIFAEPQFLNIFDLPFISGNEQSLNDMSSVLVSKSLAEKLFKYEDAVGKTFSIDERMDVTISGVYEDFAKNSTFAGIQFIGAWEMIYRKNEWKNMTDPWRPNMFFVYTLMHPGTSYQHASEKIRDVKLRNVNETLAKKKPALFIHPMSRWHLHDEFKEGKEAGGRIQYVWMFGTIGVFVMLMACINFMNLSTARSEKRAKEIGVRKAIGSLRRQLIVQFFFESVMTSLFSALIALLIVQLSLPWFNEIASKQMSLPWMNIKFWIGFFAFSVFVGILAGSYPAFYMSAIRTISVIKGVFKAGSGAFISRKVMVTVQFAISTLMIVGTAIVYMQIQHAKDRPMGYNSKGLISMWLPFNGTRERMDAVRNELINSGSVIGMAEAGSTTTVAYSSSSGFDWKGKDPNLSVDFNTNAVSHDYGKTINWTIMHGRDFSTDFPSDTSAIIINEAMARFIGLENPVGEIIRWHDHPLTVIGVVANIVNGNPYQEVRPNVYHLFEGYEGVLIARLNPEMSATQAIAGMEKVVKKFDAGAPFTFQFVDDAYQEKFGNEERIGRLSTIFASLAIFISCLGIFGLSSFMAEQKSKEIGVRKILGASVFQLWKLMCKDFVLLVMIACVIAIPVAYLFLSQWLESFVYRTTLSWWVFAGSAGATLLIMLVTISWHTIQAARVNPSQSLRSE
ncbi:ABC transporter permease [Chryseolinea sp. T2]|uniref:ABC transporter permease n=1 Tax=Chryseolinea sp. T2 TaxID=3129255 RepID=UPI0030768D3C